MTNSELKELLEQFRNMPAETEWLEFKEAKTKFNFDKLGKYFSALSNEANLNGKQFGWLILGIEDKERKIVGSNYKNNKLDDLKSAIANHINMQLTFSGIFELNISRKRIVMFQIPAAPKGLPIAWKGFFYGRDGQSLGALNINEFEEIRGQIKRRDWSAEICKNAKIDALDPEAIAKARIEFKNKFPRLKSEVDKWDDIAFLNKAKVTIRGKITNTAIILLGKEESEHFISPSVAKIS